MFSSRAIQQRVAEAQALLRDLGFDGERSNERSAQVLLALAGLTPSAPWSVASSPLIRTVEIMQWLRDHYERDYKPNTRETIRRFTLHQFVQAAMVVENPDQPDRPTNSPKWSYQLSGPASALLMTVGTDEYSDRLRDYLAAAPGLVAQHARAREMQRIPVTLSDGTTITLSPGGQNVLLKQMIEEFCARFTPGGSVLYVGDADDKYAVFDDVSLGELGISVPDRGKMPDLIVYLAAQNWLVLLEAASAHGPVDATRYQELHSLFEKSTAGLVLVSCFPSRDEMRRYLPHIAWETEVWCADNPTHLIHFNGERFLGPYS